MSTPFPKIATISTKGQVTVPRRVRRQLGWQTGTRLAFRVRNGLIEVRTAPAVVEVHGRWDAADLAAEAARRGMRVGTLLREKVLRLLEQEGSEGR